VNLWATPPAFPESWPGWNHAPAVGVCGDRVDCQADERPLRHPASTLVSYLMIAIGQTAVGLADVPPSISPWSPTYLVTFIGLLIGFLFGWIAILGPLPRRETEPN
jgi:hypothetical protein